MRSYNEHRRFELHSLQREKMTSVREHNIQKLLVKQSKNQFLDDEEKGVVLAYESRTRKHRMQSKKKRK